MVSQKKKKLVSFDKWSIVGQKNNTKSLCK